MTNEPARAAGAGMPPHRERVRALGVIKYRPLKLSTKIVLAGLAVGLVWLLTGGPAPEPLAPTPLALKITRLPTASANHPAVIVLTPEAGRTPVPDPRLFINLSARDRQAAPVPVWAVVELPGQVLNFGPAPRQLLSIPIVGTPWFTVTVTATGYMTVTQKFQVTLTADSDFEWVVDLDTGVNQ